MLNPLENLTAAMGETYHTFNEAEDAHARLQQVALGTIQSLQESNGMRQNAITSSKAEHANLAATHAATLNALNEKITRLSTIQADLEKTIVARETEIASLQTASEKTQEIVNDLVNNPARQDEALNAYRALAWARCRKKRL